MKQHYRPIILSLILLTFCFTGNFQQINAYNEGTDVQWIAGISDWEEKEMITPLYSYKYQKASFSTNDSSVQITVRKGGPQITWICNILTSEENRGIYYAISYGATPLRIFNDTDGNGFLSFHYESDSNIFLPFPAPCPNKIFDDAFIADSYMNIPVFHPMVKINETDYQISFTTYSIFTAFIDNYTTTFNIHLGQNKTIVKFFGELWINQTNWPFASTNSGTFFITEEFSNVAFLNHAHENGQEIILNKSTRLESPYVMKDPSGNEITSINVPNKYTAVWNRSNVISNEALNFSQVQSNTRAYYQNEIGDNLFLCYENLKFQSPNDRLIKLSYDPEILVEFKVDNPNQANEPTIDSYSLCGLMVGMPFLIIFIIRKKKSINLLEH